MNESAKLMSELSRLTESSTSFSKGDKVKVHNAKSYDSLAKDETEGVFVGMVDEETAMVKAGSGQMNVSLSDLSKAE